MEKNPIELNAVAEAAQAAEIDILDGAAPTENLPATWTMLDSLFGQYQNYVERINECTAFWKDTRNNGVFHYFLEGNADINRGRTSLSGGAEQLFNGQNAIAALNASFWCKALAMTDILSFMPQKRRDEWNKLISEHKTPAFEEETVRATIADLLRARSNFMAERVDGLFQGLSRSHVTNVPEGFSKRMILSYALDNWGHPNHSTSGVINDLRCVIAKFMGRDDPGYGATYRVMDKMVRRSMYGEWQSVDGGALRIKIFMKGTAHLEVHPDMAYRLNCVLAQMHPLAIPPEFRTKPKKKHKDFEMMGRPLSFAALDILEKATVSKDNSVWLYQSTDRRVVYKEAKDALESLGGVLVGQKYQFDYKISTVLTDVLMSGTLPDQQTHQFYPTPLKIAEFAVDWAEIGDADDCLEPSAGTGNIASLLPKERTQCVEISSLHCRILDEKGYTVEQADFLEWADKTAMRFDRIVMNPPFSQGRAVAHTKAALQLLKTGGVLVSILPASYRFKSSEFAGDGLTVDWSDAFVNEFAGTSVSVVVVKIGKK